MNSLPHNALPLALKRAEERREEAEKWPLWKSAAFLVGINLAAWGAIGWWVLA